MAQFRTPDGTCELYWRCADAEVRQPAERWCDYAARSADEVPAGFRALPVAELIAEGLQHWREVAALHAAGADVAEYLYFVLYFDAPAAEPGVTRTGEAFSQDTVRRFADGLAEDRGRTAMNVSDLTAAGKWLALAAAVVTVAWGVGAGVWMPAAAPFWRLVGILPGLATFAVGAIALWAFGVRVFKPGPGRQ